ncbi:MAG: GntR family transcriptional regulator [Acidimicrobiia bacterium]
MTQPSTPPIRHRTTQAAVADMLRSEILQGRIPPGTRLLQNEIAENFETSTTPVREALRQLVAEGLLDGDAHRGVTVHQTSSMELSHIYELRLALEPIAMKATAQTITEDDLSAAEDLVDQMDEEDDPARWIELNASFHRLLADSSGRPLLASIVDNLRNLSSLYIAESLNQVDRRQRANREHRDLVDSLRSHDIDQAVEAEQSHLEHTLELGTAMFADAAESS